MHPLFHTLFVDYCTYFNGNEDYFECHEVLEEYWKQIAPNDKNHPLVGYIQLATGMYHWRRENLKGALRTFNKAFNNFRKNENSIFFEYIDYDLLCESCKESTTKVEKDCPFTSFQLPILSKKLEHLVSEKINDLPNHSYHFLLNKHMLRDRSDILIARELKRKMKGKKEI